MNQWTTVSIVPTRGNGVRPGRTLCASLEEIAGLVALEPGVLGVEVAGPDTWGAPEPHLVAYATREAGSTVAQRAKAIAAGFGVAVTCEIAHHEGDDYLDAWKAFHPPLWCGRTRSLLVQPSWLAPPTEPPPTTVILDPGRAFGTGRHASTRLCLDWIADRARPFPRTVLDLGCGSGVLAIAASLRFGAEVEAVDADPDAVATTRENAAANHAPLRAFAADVASAPPGPFDCVLANIRPDVLVPNATAILDRVREGGVAVLSGILTEEADRVRRTYEAAGARTHAAAERDGWTLVEAHRPARAPR